MESIWTEFATLDTRETLVYRPSLDISLKLIGYSFHSWRWQECTLVRYPFDISVLITYAGDQFHNHRGDRRHAKVRAGVTCHVLLRLQGERKEGPSWATLIGSLSALQSILFLLCYPLRILFDVPRWCSKPQQRRTHSVFKGLVESSRTSSHLSDCRCLGRMSEHISAVPSQQSLSAPGGPRRLKPPK